MKTHINRLPARYLPGGIWQTVSRAIDFSASGITTPVIMRVIFMEIAISAALAGFIGALLYLASESVASHMAYGSYPNDWGLF
ncbi:MAG: hypothetical protein MZV65_47755 [Chromatiales bacterium]|nr:hypothetical protein [Chromatiales bacterium]MCK7582527.1 hypothetical protein [Chromatiales bacterium]